MKKEEFTEKEKRNIDILEILRKQGPVSRPEISREMGINVVSISNYIDEFIKNNLVYEKELDISEGGRRPALLDLDPKAGYVIGVGLNLMNMVGVMVDLKGNIVSKTQIARPLASVKEIAESLLEIIHEILRRSKDYTSLIKGIGVGIAGLVNKKDGSIRWPQRMGSQYTYASVEVPLKELIEKEFNLPVMIENDATSACFGERWKDMDRVYKNVIYMFSGVGCGIMINGEIYTGTNGYAGEISIHNNREQGALNCETDKDCFVQRCDIDLGIVEDTMKMLTEDKEAAENFFGLTSSTINNVDMKAVFAAFRANDKIAVSVMNKAAKRLGVKIAYLVNIFNPQVVIIGGGFEEAGEGFLKKVNNIVNDWAFRESTESLKIIYSQLRENAVALGAASLVMQRLFARLW